MPCCCAHRRQGARNLGFIRRNRPRWRRSAKACAPLLILWDFSIPAGYSPPMRIWPAILLVFALPGAGFAAPSEEDKLFAQLHAVGSADEARPIERKLDSLFKVSGSPSVDLLMVRA